MKKMIAIVLALMLCVSALSVVAFAAEGNITIHVQMPEGALTPSIWAWGGSGDVFAAEGWPGKQMTKNGDWWEIEVPADTTGIIVSTQGNVDQTDNIEDTFDKDVWITCTMGDDGKYDATYTFEGPGGEAVEPEEKPQEPVVIDAYYVTGSTETFGNWDAGNAAGKMTKGDDGIWSITFSNVAAGDYSVKVTIGNWDQSWGGSGENGNFDFTVAEAGDVTVKFNPETQVVDVIVNGEAMNPGTGDMNLAAVSVALLAATAGVVALVGKKKEF